MSGDDVAPGAGACATAGVCAAPLGAVDPAGLGGPGTVMTKKQDKSIDNSTYRTILHAHPISAFH